MAALRFVSFTEEVMKAVKKMKFGRALEMLFCLEEHFLRERYEVYTNWIEFTYQILVETGYLSRY